MAPTHRPSEPATPAEVAQDADAALADEGLEFVDAIPKRGSGLRGVTANPRALAIVARLKETPGKTRRIKSEENAGTLVSHLKSLGADVETRAVAKRRVERADKKGFRMAPVHDIYVTWPVDAE